MKKFILFAAALTMSLLNSHIFAQSADNEDEVIKIDRWNQQAYREGEILVKFRAEGAVQMKAPRRAKFQTSQVSAIDALFAEIGVDSVEQLMPQTGHKNVGRRVRAHNGSEVVVKDLSKLYRVTLKAEKAQDIHAAIERLKAQEEVEFAEPNYLVYTMALPYDADIPTADQATYKAEPLYSQQWGLAAINLPALWDKPKKSSKRPVIAILDTGVDIEHPDLAANIWTNTAEANGIANQDDDANGFKDDIHGWDFINNHSVTNDFNGHGTHCAGIAAAVGNNGIGITGANPDALIMPVTVMQSTGTGDVATIVKGIDYAAANGADVISMSIGGYSYSMAEEQALGRAYANAILVAAAGNDGFPIVKFSMFPAAFSFVLGVEASKDATGQLATFSNYDGDGPIYSTFGEDKLYNYELRAPGQNIMSTFPNGRYKSLNGTSMACPLVAGAISRLIQCKEIASQELLFGDLIHARQNNIDILATYSITDADRKPALALVTYSINDENGGDGDSRADAGETLEIYPTFKNAWGQAENIRFWIKTGYYSGDDWVADDETLITHLQESVDFGKPISSYAKATSANPWRMKVNPDCADGRQINLTLFATCDNMQGTLMQHIVLTVENGVEIGGMITEDLTLYPNLHYIVTNKLAIPANVTLTIRPGTVLKFKDNAGISIATNGIMNAIGKSDSMIVFSTADNAIGQWGLTINSKSEIHYAILEKMYNNDQLFTGGVYEDCIIRNSIVAQAFMTGHGQFTGRKLHIYNTSFWSGLSTEESSSSSSRYYNCNIVNNIVRCPNMGMLGAVMNYSNAVKDNVWECNLFGVENTSSAPAYVATSASNPVVIHLNHPLYFGSAREDLIRPYILDINNGYGYCHFDLSNTLTRPSAEAHGIVWKILVDGIDAQDEFELLPPIGVGRHKCEVYFNRPMDVSVTPTVSFGVRQPYTQHQVAENGSWSADSTIYTAYFTIDGKSVTDGLNTFKVYGAEDPEHFEIPEENFRFHMEVAAAGSMSTGLMAEAGLGKVTLTWETDEEDFADLLGYNLYRWATDTLWYNYHYDSNVGKYVYDYKFDTICINSSLIDAEDVQFIDYDVIPGKDYYYVIRQVTTSLSTYDLSNAVVARPLTAIKGDANGSMSVDVADVITEVNYITGQNPQPFIFEAADVNSDADVNIIDVVATVNLILHPTNNTSAINEGNVSYSIENGILYVETDVVLGGVQCTFAADKEQTITPLAALDEFEKTGVWQSEDQYLFLAYSMSGKTLGVGKHALLQIGDAELTSIVLSDAQGHNISTAPGVSTALDGTQFIPAASKYIQNGNLFIRLGNRTYGVMGTEVR